MNLSMKNNALHTVISLASSTSLDHFRKIPLKIAGTLQSYRV